MTILDKIVEHKRLIVANRKKEIPLEKLKGLEHYSREPWSLREFLTNKNKTGIIAEFKRKSPSKGIINNAAAVGHVVAGYENAVASAVSVLTDETFFGGTLNDLLEARKVLNIPLLRKDFIIEEYQVHEAKAYGADVILLIAAILTKEEVEQFASLAKELSLSILFEIHHQEELEKLSDDIEIVGVNNRNLKTFEVDIRNSISLSQAIPGRCVKVSESGISEISKIKELKKHGFQGFLIGENFMKTDDPGKAAKEFMKELR
jgi:indole-3-glycerol phosphate synthase